MLANTKRLQAARILEMNAAIGVALSEEVPSELMSAAGVSDKEIVKAQIESKTRKAEASWQSS